MPPPNPIVPVLYLSAGLSVHRIWRAAPDRSSSAGGSSLPYPGSRRNRPIDRFYWIEEGRLAGCSLPGRTAGIHDDLAWLRAQGISAILTLTETPLDPDALAAHNFASLHLPVQDMTPPSPDQLMAALRFIDLQSGPVAVHCLMGQGRTGTVLAAYLIRAGATSRDALQQLRLTCPNAVENPLQERALDAFAARADWVV